MSDQKKYAPHEINLITLALETKGVLPDGHRLTVDELGQLSLGTYSMKVGYWADRYLKAGAKVKERMEKGRVAAASQPASRAEVAQMIIGLASEELIPLAFSALQAINIVTDALIAKGLLTEEDMEAARLGIEKEVDSKIPTMDKLKSALTEGAGVLKKEPEEPTKDETSPPETSSP